MRGGYAGHGETYSHPEDLLWWAKGGVLHGESWKRIGFLREIIEEDVATGLTPARRTNGRGRASPASDGDVRFIYFGEHQPDHLDRRPAHGRRRLRCRRHRHLEHDGDARQARSATVLSETSPARRRCCATRSRSLPSPWSCRRNPTRPFACGLRAIQGCIAKGIIPVSSVQIRRRQEVLRPDARSFRAFRSTSPTASLLSLSVRPAAANRRCCGWSLASRRSPRRNRDRRPRRQ